MYWRKKSTMAKKTKPAWPKLYLDPSSNFSFLAGNSLNAARRCSGWRIRLTEKGPGSNPSWVLSSCSALGFLWTLQFLSQPQKQAAKVNRRIQITPQVSMCMCKRVSTGHT